ncbi:polymer-forming cytoskeletal protein [Halomicrobium salinisoli]|uniref:polymer-forming cytoskeletal protein n=1 Tax=Halomicrobium salinisoli TaxID=2878391 RepID=UPI001CF063E2|nr:polymer-forming cytoskeletal protein [Halomicrobium salinisoli]
MSIGTDPLDRLVIPDGTTVEEHDLVTDGNVVVGGQSTVDFGVRGRSVIAGERVSFGGHIEAEGDCRLDMWCDVEEDVLVGEDAYVGERVHVGGELRVAGDLDIGDDVDIEEGFEANGWIVIRNPMPTVVFLFVYLSHLLRIGEEEAAEDVLTEVAGDDAEGDPVLIPRGARVGDDVWRVSTPAVVGDDCRLHGNLRAESLEVGRDNTVFGSLRAREDVVVGRGSEIKGDVTTRGGTVRVGPGAKVWGDVSADDVELHENATVDGTIRARGEVEMHTDEVLDRPDETAEAMIEMAEELEDGDAADDESDDDDDAESAAGTAEPSD